VVTFIVQAVNDILDKDFDINFGLGNRRVTILDPATGTGTFLYEVIKQVYRNFERYGVNKWNELLRESQLLSRLYGFELLMTPYTIAHLKLALLLESIGYKFEPEDYSTLKYYTKKNYNFFFTNELTVYYKNNPKSYSKISQKKNFYETSLKKIYKELFFFYYKIYKVNNSQFSFIKFIFFKLGFTKFLVFIFISLDIIKLRLFYRILFKK
jgi:hypothetical protein